MTERPMGMEVRPRGAAAHSCTSVFRSALDRSAVSRRRELVHVRPSGHSRSRSFHAL